MDIAVSRLFFHSIPRDFYALRPKLQHVWDVQYNLLDLLNSEIL